MSCAQRPLVHVNDGAASSSGRGAGGLSRAAPRTVAGARLEHRCDTFRLNSPRRGRGAYLPCDAQGARRAGAAPSWSPSTPSTYTPAAAPSRNPNGTVRRRPPAPPARARPVDVIFLQEGNRARREKLTRTGPTAPARVPAGSLASDDADPTRFPPTHAHYRKQAPCGREQRRETRGRDDRPGLAPMRLDRVRRGAGRPRRRSAATAFRAVAGAGRAVRFRV